MTHRVMPDVSAGVDELELDYDDRSDDWEDGEVHDGSEEGQNTTRGNERVVAMATGTGVLQKSSMEDGGTLEQQNAVRTGTSHPRKNAAGPTSVAGRVMGAQSLLCPAGDCGSLSYSDWSRG
ncbi:hypothetical protein NDU88_005936 [Pleurodeles waltl]|uniref:Uncharacterized protein n=1 Tax=Pleurodeles waltl TaxID=8319 RepID=A0AAV7MAT3_PLEWA|nr:hypothetical protein NDU88_005936 [Pleurodeles waltl]